jgi:hypothetical protein
MIENESNPTGAFAIARWNSWSYTTIERLESMLDERFPGYKLERYYEEETRSNAQSNSSSI